MDGWVSAADGFIETDVIRWMEAVFSRRKAKRGKALRIGKRHVTAQVASDRHGWVELEIISCKIIADEAVGHTVEALKPTAKIQRSKKTIMRGRPERLLWSDISARAIVASRFIGPEAPDIS
jgi:hypothetical protein